MSHTDATKWGGGANGHHKQGLEMNMQILTSTLKCQPAMCCCCYYTSACMCVCVCIIMWGNSSDWLIQNKVAQKANGAVILFICEHL